MNASEIPIPPQLPGVNKGAARTIKFLSIFNVLILSILIVGCDNQPRLKVSMTETSGNDALVMLGAQSFVFDFDYSGTATEAELFVQAFKDGKLTKPYMSIGGVGGFNKPVQKLKLKIYVDIFDSRTSVMKLATQNKVEGDFYRITSSAKWDNSQFGGGDKTISTDQMECSGFRTCGPVSHPDLSHEYVPVGCLKSTRKGTLGAGLEIPGDGSKLEEGCDYVIFYLRLNKHAGP